VNRIAKDCHKKVIVEGDRVTRFGKYVEGLVVKVRNNGVIDVAADNNITYTSASFLWEKIE
jgi:hypothetical protein